MAKNGRYEYICCKVEIWWQSGRWGGKVKDVLAEWEMWWQKGIDVVAKWELWWQSWRCGGKVGVKAVVGHVER